MQVDSLPRLDKPLINQDEATKRLAEEAKKVVKPIGIKDMVNQPKNSININDIFNIAKGWLSGKALGLLGFEPKTNYKINLIAIISAIIGAIILLFVK